MNTADIGNVFAQIMVWGTAIMGFLNVLQYFSNPVKKQVERIDKLEEHQANDLGRLQQIEKDNKQLLLSVNQLMSHIIDGNHVDKLKKRKEDLEEYLINR